MQKEVAHKWTTSSQNQKQEDRVNGLLTRYYDYIILYFGGIFAKINAIILIEHIFSVKTIVSNKKSVQRVLFQRAFYCFMKRLILFHGMRII